MSSMANASFKVCVKLVAVLVTFPVILSTGIISKGAVFYTTSQIGREITKLASEGQIQFRKLNKVTQSLELPVRIRFSTTSDRHQRLLVASHPQFPGSQTGRTDEATDGCTFLSWAAERLFALDLHSAQPTANDRLGLTRVPDSQLFRVVGESR